MRYHTIISFILSVVIYMTSCSTEKNIAWKERNIEFLAAETSFPDTTYLKNMKMVQLENKGSQSIINNITKIIEIDNQLYIFDRTLNQITVFDKAGRFIRTINHMGHGKGEYIHLIDVTYDKKGGELLCLADPNSIIHYTADGTYTGTDRLHGFYTDISCDDSYIYLYHSTYADAKTPEYTLSCKSKKDGKITELLPFTEEHAPFCRQGSKLFSNGKDVTFVRKFDRNIYHVSNANIDSCFSINMKEFAFPANKPDKKYDCVELYDLCKKNKLIYMMTNVVEGERAFMFSSNLYGIYVAHPVNGQCRNYSYMNVTKYNLPLSLFTPVEGVGNKCCFILQASTVKNFKQMYETDPRVRKSINAQFIEDFKDISEESNPILFIYNVK